MTKRWKIKPSVKRAFYIVASTLFLAAGFQNCSSVDFDQMASQKSTSIPVPSQSPGPSSPAPTPSPSSTPAPSPSPSPTTSPAPTPSPVPHTTPMPPPAPTLNQYGCPTTLPAPTTTCRKYLTSGNQFKVPCDWNSASNSIEAIGNGADGGGDVRAGGGGGAYSKSVNVVLVPGAPVAYSMVHNSMGYPLEGHTVSMDAGDTYFCNSTSGCSSMQDAAVVVGASGGYGSTNNGNPYFGYTVDAIAGQGGPASAGVATGPGAVKYSGGAGGNCMNGICSAMSQPGSGGGAAGPHGNGAAGGSGQGLGGAADAGYGGAGGGVGQAGGNGTEWDASHGAGGGGSGGSFGVPGGFGGNYGGGGGGGGSDQTAWGQVVAPAADATGVGGGGLIVITYQGSSCQ